MTARGQERVRAREAERHQQRVQHQEAVGAEQPDERRGEQRIDVTPSRKKRCGPPLPRLRKIPSGPRRELLPHPHEVVALILEVQIVRRGCGRACSTSPRHRRSRPRPSTKSTDSAHAVSTMPIAAVLARAEPPGQAASLQAGGDALIDRHRVLSLCLLSLRAVARKLRSCFRIPARPVAREVSWSRSYSRSIFRTNAAMS